MDWRKIFEGASAYWRHDGHPERPYALLTSDNISNFFFNGSKVIERPNLVEQISDQWTLEFRRRITAEADYPDVVVGPATGAITLAYELARAFPGARAWFTEEDGGMKKLKRFAPDLDIKRALVVEDVITTGESAQETVNAVEATGLEVYPFVFCIINRSGKTSLPDGKEIVALIEEPDATSWERGKNPFNPGGEEFVEPVRAKANWGILTKPYD